MTTDSSSRVEFRHNVVRTFGMREEPILSWRVHADESNIGRQTRLFSRGVDYSVIDYRSPFSFLIPCNKRARQI